MSPLRIGVVGYSGQPFDAERGLELLRRLLDAVRDDFPERRPEIVSGLTDLGVPGLAYQEARRRGWRTVGVACAKARDFDCFPVDERVIVGHDWGDESDTFLARVDVLVRVGGGRQALTEARAFDGPVYAAELAVSAG